METSQESYLLSKCRPPDKSTYFSIETYVAGTQMNRLNETVLLSTRNTYSSSWIRKYTQFYAINVRLSGLKENETHYPPENLHLHDKIQLQIYKQISYYCLLSNNNSYWYFLRNS